MPKSKCFFVERLWSEFSFSFQFNIEADGMVLFLVCVSIIMGIVSVYARNRTIYIERSLNDSGLSGFDTLSKMVLHLLTFGSEFTCESHTWLQL